MLITRETDYGLRILRALADGKLHTVSEIVEDQMIPQQFTYKIIRKLKAAELIEVLRGVTGGCKLAKPLEEVSLLDLILAIDGKNQVSACLDPNFACPWREAHGGCHVHCELEKVEGTLEQEMGSHMIADLI